MTIWDKIYKQYQKGETKWATLSEGIDQRFSDLINNTDFCSKSAFDIGCGTGKYLKYLQEKGFEVAGIDSSETSVNMTKKLLGNNADIQLDDMFSFAFRRKTNMI